MLTDKHSTIRNGEDTFADKILLLLKEINPIIYAEGQRSHGYADWRKWNKYNIYSLSGWSYQQLSKSIYKFLCVKKEKTINDLKDTLLLSMWGIKGNRNIYDRMTELIANLPETLQTQNLRPNEVGMEEVQNARFRAERNY